MDFAPLAQSPIFATWLLPILFFFPLPPGFSLFPQSPDRPSTPLLFSQEAILVGGPSFKSLPFLIPFFSLVSSPPNISLTVSLSLSFPSLQTVSEEKVPLRAMFCTFKFFQEAILVGGPSFLPQFLPFLVSFSSLFFFSLTFLYYSKTVPLSPSSFTILWGEGPSARPSTPNFCPLCWFPSSQPSPLP